MAAEAPGDVVNLLFVGLSSESNTLNIETYISAKADDDDVEVVKVNMLGNGKAIATIKGIRDVDAFINQCHKIGGQQVELTVVTDDPSILISANDGLDDPLDESPCSNIIPNQVEVTCSTTSINEEILDLYFSGKKSGGKKEKEIQSIEPQETRGIYHVTYESEEDAALVVAQDRHVCGKVTFSVRYVPAPIPKEYDKDKLIVKEIPKEVDEDLLVAFIEGRLGLESDEDFQVDFRDTCAIIMFTKEYADEELDEMIKMTKKNIKKQTLVIERCEVNCCIIFSNIKESFAKEDTLGMYLEQERSGAGEEMVENIKMLGNNSAKVTFVSPAVVTQVLHSINHHRKKLGADVTLTVCTPLDSIETEPPKDDAAESEDSSTSSCSDTDDKIIKNKTEKQPIKVANNDHTDSNEKTSKKKKKKKQRNKQESSDEEEVDQDDPKQNILHAPVVYPLDQMIAKYLKSTPSVVQELSKNVEVSITIDEKLGNVTLSQNEFSPKNWPSIVAEKWEHSLSDLVYMTDIHVPPEGATEIYPIIMAKSTQEGLQHAFGKGDNKVCLVGKADVVRKLENDIEELCSRMIKKSEAVMLSEEDYIFLQGVMFTQMQSDHPSIQLKCIDLDHSLSANGSLHDVGILKQNLPKYIAHSRIQVSLHPMAIEFLRVGKGGPGVLCNLLQARTFKCVPYYVGSTSGYTLFLLYAKQNEHAIESLVKTVSNSIKIQQLSLPKGLASSIANGSSKFANFKENLMKSFPHYSVIQQDSTLLMISANDVFISVQQGYNQFINEECSTVESVRFKKGAWRLLQTTKATRLWSDLTSELKKIDILIVSSSKPSARRPFVKIKGMSDSIEIAKEKIITLQKSIVERDIPIARPGVCNYFFKDPNGQMILKGIENEANVCIEMDMKDHGGDPDITSTRSSSSPEFLKACFGNTNEMKQVNVYVGDITKFNRAEVIVNAANENLQHAGGVAQAIEAKGGAQIRRDSENHIRTKGKVKTGHAVIFPRVGNLPPPYKAIVHAVGPKWEYKSTTERAFLRKAVQESLMLAKDYSSIAIPAISGGIYGFPPDVCAEVLMEAVKRFSQETGMSCSLNEINFVVFQNNVDTFVAAAKNSFNNIHCYSDTVPGTPPTNITPIKTCGRRRRRPTTSTTPISTSALSQPSSSLGNTRSNTPQKRTTYQSSVTKKIKITQGDILKHLENVIVNTTDEKFSFNGFVAKALKKGAGLGLEEECEATPIPISKGSVITTGAHGLSASYILHVVLPPYSELNSIKILSDVIVKCLEETNRLGMKSISIPSVGAGNLGYPGDEVAKCLLQTTADYISKNQHKSLSLVHFVVFEKSIYQQFKMQYSALSGGRHQKQETYHQPSQPAVFTGTHQSCSFSLPNNLRLEVIQGDITDAAVDVIVNTTSSNMHLVGKGVAGALAKKAGPELQVACDKLVRQGMKLAEGNVVDTPCANMGSLLCKSIFHIVCSTKDLGKLEQTVYACLERAEKMRFTSIAFPAIGTGLTKIPPQDATNAIINALKKFTSKRTPKHLRVIHMVLFQQEHYSQFVDVFKKMEANSGGFLRKVFNAAVVIGSYLGYKDDDGDDRELVQDHMEVDSQSKEEEGQQLEDSLDEYWDSSGEQDILANLSKTAEVILTIFGETSQCVGRAEKKVQNIIDNQFIDENINHEDVSYLSESTVIMLKEVANNHQVDIDIEKDPDLHFISLHGLSADVLLVKDKVRDVLASFGQDKMMKEAAEAMAKHIRWVRVLDDDDTDEYDGVFTFEIESAFQRKDNKYISSNKEDKFEIDFSKMEETDLVYGDKVKVKRLDLLQEEKPTNWDSMPTDTSGKEVEAHYVDLQPGSQEYTEMEQKFNTTMRKGQEYKDIVSIQRIQNPILYGQFAARKREMDKRNPSNCINERWLFHGTSPDSVNAITTQGFNRSFQGKNAVVYGQGAYFARDATYSNRDTYSVPDANGVKNMYVARVLTGEYIVGNGNMIVPPPKNPQLNKHVLFDSTVDNMASPSIYVVYGDSQSYPAYLIKYKKN